MVDDEPNSLFQWLAPRISFDIAPNAFTVQAKDTSITIPTYLYLRKVNRRHEIVTVGEDPSDLNDAYRVDLFEGNDPPNDGFDKLDCLEAYFRYALSALSQKIGRRWFLRPIVVVRGVDRLANVVGGYQRSLIREALTRAGAASIRFE